MKNAIQTEIETAQRIAHNLRLDLAELEERWPKSKRGSRAQQTLDSIKGRVEGLDLCHRDALLHIDALPEPRQKRFFERAIRIPLQLVRQAETPHDLYVLFRGLGVKMFPFPLRFWGISKEKFVDEELRKLIRPPFATYDDTEHDQLVIEQPKGST